MCFRWCPYRKSNETNKNWIKTSDISSELSDHVMNKKLDFNDKCGSDYILEVARKLKVYSSLLTDNGIPIIRGTEYYRHRCEMEVRLSIPLGKDYWKIGTAFHKGFRKAK